MRLKLVNRSRRRFIQSGAGFCGACVISSCSERHREPRVVTLIQASELREGETELPLQRILLQRSGNEVRALSILCTHQSCVITKSSDASFVCPCHGSTFDAKGHVLQGPANRDLPWYKLTLDETGMIRADLSSSVGPEWALIVP